MKQLSASTRLVTLLPLVVLLSCQANAGHDDDGRPSSPCSPTDRAALLGFKSGIATDTTGILATWSGADCCGAWDGVSCDAATGRVVALQLEAPPPKERHYMAGTISQSLGNLEFMETLVIRDMGKIGGAIPAAALSRLTRLKQLYLEDNLLVGPIPGSLAKLRSLQFLSLAGNRLEGHLPPELGAVSGLQQINVARNRLAGAVPQSYKNLSKLAYIDMSNNFLSGPIPGFIGQFKNLALLDLSNNSFSGDIPASLCTLRSLTDLSLSHNKLTGQIPSKLGSLRSLSSLAIADNKLVGSIPSLLGLQKLWNLNLSRNLLSGPLPAVGLSSLVSMDLSHNRLTGGIDDFLRSLSLSIPVRATTVPQNKKNLLIVLLPQKLEHLDLSGNRVAGALPEFAGGGLKWLDVSSNAIGGQIPSTVSKLQDLERLDVSRNRVRGVIPASMAGLARLQWLDLSSNEIVGRIPENFTRMGSIRHGSFRRNKLCGQIPQARPFNLFPAAAYAHNLCLCGKPLPPCRKIL
ncbi:hypothetical protein PR202_gb13927 [Eleusine coracana subsp. coracana]|uniref:Leucine-rich repeat-containing N-terminal plant-type domain-containing protein n=1 Tax=Eleusine coracana subsp. coracana TaxID=191504 RepID=A0AAV5ETQ3_ELECO|nr:hypothetical protein QOZ80_4BG0330110 [Eleusine coracana subsp. coracana]GJN26030.1 hypothetical protein PR202_gb13927 [Eleusine coracana subsp. coracana]